jgi:hypothetical protein
MTAILPVLSVTSLALLCLPVLSARQDVRERQVLVSVTGPNDVFTAGLGPDAFDVREDGQSVEIVRVAPAPPPSHVALVFNDPGVFNAFNWRGNEDRVLQLREALTAAIGAVATELNGTQVAIFVGADPLPGFSADLAQAALAVSQLGPRARGTILDALSLALGELQKREASHPVVVMLRGEGDPARVRRTTLEDSVRKAGASLWGVVLETRTTEAAPPWPAITPLSWGTVLSDVTRRSGGVERRVNSMPGVLAALERVIGMAASRYEVTYRRRAGASVAPRNLEVRLRTGGSVAGPRWASQITVPGR